MILQLNRAFLTQISERMRLFTPKTPISDIFLSFMPHFKMYTSYCCKHSQISEMVVRLRNDNKSFKSFLKKSETHAKHPIGDFLIAPVQRIPRLALLIESLLKFTDSVHPDYEQLKLALEEAQNAARLINTKMHEVEVRSKVVAIHKQFDPMIEDFLDGPLVQPHRVFVHEGVLARKSGARSAMDVDDDFWSDSEEDECDKQEDSEKGKYYCFLFNDMLLVGTSIGKGKTKRLVYETSFELATTFIREDMNGLCWQLVNPRCTYTWLCQTTQEAADWKRNMEETIENLLKQHPTLRAQRSRVEVSFDEDTNEYFAEIKATPRAAPLDPVKYREEVLENTQKHLTAFMHEHHAALAKHRSTVGSPKRIPTSSVFQRVKDTLTPKKRTSVRLGDENGNANAPMSPNTNLGSPIVSTVVVGKGKADKLMEMEELDGVTCINRHLEHLTQELQAVRDLRRQARQDEINGLTSPSRRLTRAESIAVPKAASDATIRQLKSVLSTNQFNLSSIQIPTASSAPELDENLAKKKSKVLKGDQKRVTLASPTPAPARRSTVVAETAPASPLSIPTRALDTDSMVPRKATPKARRGRMSLGGTDAHKVLSKSSLPTPLAM